MFMDITMSIGITVYMRACACVHVYVHMHVCACAYMLYQKPIVRNSMHAVSLVGGGAPGREE